MRLVRWFVRYFYPINLTALLFGAGFQLFNILYGQFSLFFCALLSVGMTADLLALTVHRYVPGIREKMDQYRVSGPPE